MNACFVKSLRALALAQALCLLPIFLPACPAPAHAQAEAQPQDGAREQVDPNECDSYPDVPIHIATRFDDPVYDFSTGINDIQAMASDTRHTIRESLTLGLTRYVPLLSFGVPVRQVRFPNGVSCAHVQRVDVTFGYKDVTVYVAREIPQGTCGFDQIMAHEQKHIDVNRAILDEYTPQIEQRLKPFLRDNGVFKEPNLDYATNLLEDKLRVILNDTIEQIVADNEQRQHQVDSPAEYRRITYSCNGQLEGIARHFLAGR